jgi:hypothetical protein
VVVQVGAFNEHPPKNSMASFSFTITVLDKGTTLVFGSWICIANGSGGFNVHLANSRKPEPSTPNRCSNLDKFVNNLDELLLPDHTEEIERMSVFNATSTHAAPELVGLDSNRSEEATWFESLSDLEEDLDRLLKLEDMGATTCWGGAPSTTTRS